jgi:hypothetical protein
MHPAIEGALVGAGVAVFLIAAEYFLLRKAVGDRAERLKRKAEFDVTDRRRMTSMTRFAVFLPIAFAIGFWLVS